MLMASSLEVNDHPDLVFLGGDGELKEVVAKVEALEQDHVVAGVKANLVQ